MVLVLLFLWIIYTFRNGFLKLYRHGDDCPAESIRHCRPFYSILENKLKAIGLDGNTIDWFDAYLTNRMQVTDVGGIFSDPNGRAPPYIGERSVVRVHLGLGHFSDTTKFDSIWKTRLIKSE